MIIPQTIDRLRSSRRISWRRCCRKDIARAVEGATLAAPPAVSFEIFSGVIVGCFDTRIGSDPGASRVDRVAVECYFCCTEGWEAGAFFVCDRPFDPCWRRFRRLVFPGITMSLVEVKLR